jgi:cytochrome b561
MLHNSFVTYLPFTTKVQYFWDLFGVCFVFIVSRCGCTSNQVEPVYDENGKWQHCEAKYHFVFYVFRRLMFFFGFYLCYINIDQKNALMWTPIDWLVVW